MPVYEYTCRKCSKHFDEFVRSMSSADDYKPACPKCGSEETARALSVFAVGAEGAARSTGGGESPSCGRCGGAPGSCQM